MIYLGSTQAAGTLIHIQNSAGEDILTYAPTKQYQSVAFSSSQLIVGETYSIYLGGSANGTVTDSLIQDASYSPGTLYTSFTMSGSVTMVGSGGGGGFRRP